MLGPNDKRQRPGRTSRSIHAHCVVPSKRQTATTPNDNGKRPGRTSRSIHARCVVPSKRRTAKDNGKRRRLTEKKEGPGVVICAVHGRRRAARASELNEVRPGRCRCRSAHPEVHGENGPPAIASQTARPCPCGKRQISSPQSSLHGLRMRKGFSKSFSSAPRSSRWIMHARMQPRLPQIADGWW